MKRSFLAALFCVCAMGVFAARPEFKLMRDAAGGTLEWCCHMVAPCLDAPVPPNPIVEDSTEKMLSLGLSWHSTPDAQSGECLTSHIYWRIPKSELSAPAYEVGAERVGEQAIIFTLTEGGQDGVVLRSPVRPLENGWVGGMEDIAKAGSRIDVEALLKELAKEKPKLAQPTPEQPRTN